MRAIVVGGGLAGLSAGYRLRQSGWDVLVLEASPRPGGRVWSIRKSGYGIELGATQLSTGYSEYLRLAREVGLDGDIVPSSNIVGLLRDGRVHCIDGRRPIGAAFSPVLSLRSKFALLRAAKDYVSLNPRMNALDVSACHTYDVESAKAYAARRLTPEIYNVLVDPLIRAYVMRTGDNISCLEWFSVLRNLTGQTMLALRGGLSRLPEALARSVETRFNAPVSEVRRTGQGVDVHVRDSAGRISVEHADACVIATRLPEACTLFPEFGATAAQLVTQLRYNRGLLVQLGYRRRTECPAVGVLIPAVEHRRIGLLWLEHNKVDDAAPEGHSLITAYFDASAIDDLFDGPDDEIVAISQEFVERLFPELKGHGDMQHASRWQLGIPNPVPGAYRTLHELKQRLDPKDNIQFAGDWFTCTGQNSAIYWGDTAARNLLQHGQARQARHQ